MATLKERLRLGFGHELHVNTSVSDFWAAVIEPSIYIAGATLVGAIAALIVTLVSHG